MSRSLEKVASRPFMSADTFGWSMAISAAAAA
jgi:hypothetical protein